MNWQLAIQEMRDVVEFEAKHAPHSRDSDRLCPKCQQALDLNCGRHTGKFFYTHRILSECDFDQVGTRILFPTRKEAETTDKIFTLK